MPSQKTLLTPELQWKRTIQYVSSLRGWEDRMTGPIGHAALWVVKTPHRLLSLGDILLVTSTNGMVERYGMSGVSSKGARLRQYFIPLRQYGDNGVVELPGDLIGLQWDDPAIGRFVADLRASSRRRVGACIPVPTPTVLANPDQGAQGLRFDGCYRSRRGPRHKRTAPFDRNYLRFFPDGKVVSGPTGGFSPRHREWFVGGRAWGMGTSGRFSVEGDSLSISILFDGQEIERFEGQIDGQYLRLSGHRHQGWSRYSRDTDVYKFGAWEE